MFIELSDSSFFIFRIDEKPKSQKADLQLIGELPEFAPKQHPMRGLKYFSPNNFIKIFSARDCLLQPCQPVSNYCQRLLLSPGNFWKLF